MNSKSSPNTLKSEGMQLPLKGFKVRVESGNPNFEHYIEGMGDGRYRIHSTLKKPHKAI